MKKIPFVLIFSTKAGNFSTKSYGKFAMIQENRTESILMDQRRDDFAGSVGYNMGTM